MKRTINLPDNYKLTLEYVKDTMSRKSMCALTWDYEGIERASVLILNPKKKIIKEIKLGLFKRLSNAWKEFKRNTDYVED